MSFFVHYGIVLLLSLYVTGGVGALLFRRHAAISNWWTNGFACLASAVGVVTGIVLLQAGDIKLPVDSGSGFSFFNISSTVDPLSALFILLISSIALVCSWYGFGYLTHWYGKYQIGILGFFYNFFLASMIMVVTANQAVSFLVAWEVMSIASYCMIVFEHREQENVKAGFIYLVMTHVGTAFIILSFLLLFKATGSFSFLDWNVVGAALPLTTKLLIAVTALMGFGTKAGIIPLHAWLPQAHPAAPSHVSALMSGVMIKIGIYMIIRTFFDFIPGLPSWFGMVVLALGATSSLLGVLYALAEHDIKRLLAYHSIENIGIILLGIGAALMFQAGNLPAFAVLGLSAALFHTINHAVFKALLFLGAGSVVVQTHTRNIEEYGGLIKYMPITATCFLVGAIAISGLPPLNGFVSEWLTYQALFKGLVHSDLLSSGIFVMGIGSLAFTGGLAAACFVKAFGATFLAKPRSEETTHTRESSKWMCTSMTILALACGVLGLGATSVISFLTPITQSLINTALATELTVGTYGTITTGAGFSSTSMVILALALVMLLGMVGLAINAVCRERKQVLGETWDCGADLNSRMEITATAFSRSLITIFRDYLQPVKHSSVTYQDGFNRYFASSISVGAELKNIYGLYCYRPLNVLAMYVSERLRRTQGGNLNVYLLYIFATLMFLLVWATR